MKIMSSQLSRSCHSVFTCLKYSNGGRLLFSQSIRNSFGNFPVNRSSILIKGNTLKTTKIKNFRPIYRNDGVFSVSPKVRAEFHTSKRRQGIGPFVYAFFKPLVNIFGIIVGRRFKSRWNALKSERKAELLDALKSKFLHIAVGSGIFGIGCYIFYLSHLSDAPLTRRRRFIVYSKKMLLQISDIQNKFLQDLHDTKMLPSNSVAYIKVEKIVRSILEKNQDIPEVRNVPWSVHVINDPHHRNVFVLPDGSIYVFTGILDVCKNDDQLAFVLAHEISHVVMSHVEENISRGYCMELLILIPIILFWATMPIELAIVSHWLTNRMNHFMITLPFCRRTEMEADYVALQLIAKACFDVRESSKFWKNMVKNSVKDSQAPPVEWLSTHPHYAKREKLLNDLMPAAIRLREFHKCPPLRDDRW